MGNRSTVVKLDIEINQRKGKVSRGEKKPHIFLISSINTSSSVL